ncbi:isochorismatase family protein [Rhizobium sp. 2YAF20]|uniref:isochorismatase family protein n=1 Tax=Rhizobium sp. 2YAF20 TaxID=3233027 RepID=UPI003F978A16
MPLWGLPHLSLCFVRLASRRFRRRPSFVGTDLDKLLDDKGIKTVIITGTASEGAVLDTPTDAASEKE